MRLLYLYPAENSDFSHFIIGIIRMSNYLNSRRTEIQGGLEEKYLDLRFEKLRDYSEENLRQYREECLILLQNFYKKFPFDVVAISCYSPFNYLNSVEVAFMIKNRINPNIIIVVGGIHPTTRSEDFQFEGIPEYFYEEYPNNTTPFDFLIREEGEIPFFNLIRDISIKKLRGRNNQKDQCFTIKSELLESLDELPVIDFSLYKRYSKEIERKGRISLDFSRGCPFRCSFCQFSLEGITCSVRLRSIENCIADLRAVKNTPWLKIKTLDISDPIFLPKISSRQRFFKDLEEFILTEGDLEFQMLIFERIETCSLKDLENYKKFNMVVEIGLESFSKTLLYDMNKVLGKNEKTMLKSIENYLKKTVEIIQKSNSINLGTQYYLLIGVPNSNINTFNEIRDFLFTPRFNGQSLIEKYHLAIHTTLYTAFPSAKMYNEGKVYFPEWWKILSKDINLYGALVDCSDDFTFIDSLNQYIDLIREIFKKQMNLKNDYYNLSHLISISKYYKDFREFYDQKVEGLRNIAISN